MFAGSTILYEIKGAPNAAVSVLSFDYCYPKRLLPLPSWECLSLMESEEKMKCSHYTLWIFYILHFHCVLCKFFQPLDDASLTELKSVLNGFLAKGEVLKLETKVGVLFVNTLNAKLCFLCCLSYLQKNKCKRNYRTLVYIHLVEFSSYIIYFCVLLYTWCFNYWNLNSEI